MFTKNLSKSFDEKKVFHEWMHVCMIMLKNIENMVRLSSTKLELKGKNAIW